MDQVRPNHNFIIEVKTPNGFKILRINNILYIEAARKYSILYLVDFNSIITYHMLKSMIRKKLIFH